MKILFYGIFSNGSLPYLLHQSFLTNGYKVYKFDIFRNYPVLASQNLAFKVFKKAFYPVITANINSSLIAYCLDVKPDILFISGARHLTVDTFKYLKKLGIYIVDWNPDCYTNPLNAGYLLSQQLKYIDLVFSPRIHMFDNYKLLGAKNCIYLDWYYVESLHYPTLCDFKYILSFVGSWSPLRELFLSQINLPVNIWGYGWHHASPQFLSRNIVSFKSIAQDSMSKIFSSTQFNLNLFTYENRDLTNLRLFEVTASKGLLISPTNSQLEEYLTPYQDFLPITCANDINYFLTQSPYSFHGIADAGHRSILYNNSNSFQARFESIKKALL